MRYLVRTLIVAVLALIGVMAVSAQASAVPFVRVTYMCAAAEDGTYNGVSVNAGDHVWRVRYESSNSDPGAPSPVNWSSNFLPGGSISADQTQYVVTATGQNGVKVFTDAGNKYGGTASVSGSTCTLDVIPDPVDPTDPVIPVVEPWVPGGREIFSHQYPAFAGLQVEIYWVAPDGTQFIVREYTIGEYGDISLIVGPTDFSADENYGEYLTESGETIAVWGRFIAVVNGVTITDVVVEAGNPVAVSYILGADEVNGFQRPSSDWEWAAPIAE